MPWILSQCNNKQNMSIYYVLLLAGKSTPESFDPNDGNTILQIHDSVHTSIFDTISLIKKSNGKLL